MTPLNEQVMNKLEDLANLIPSTEVEGESISLNDCAGVRPIDMKIKGSLYQDTYTGKNLLDKDNVTQIKGYFLDSTIIYDSGSRTLYIECEANTTYTISRTLIGKRFNVGTTSEIPTTGIEVSNIQSSESIVNEASSITITTDDEAKYLLVFYSNSGSSYANNNGYTEDELLSSIQIEYGSEATEYEPYVGGIPSPNPNYPQDIEVLTGDTTITINDTEYPLSLGDMELVGNSTYGYDYIFKKNGKWYKHNIWIKYLLTGTEAWGKSTSYEDENYSFFFMNDIGIVKNLNVPICNYFAYLKMDTAKETDGNWISSGGDSINFKVSTDLIGGNEIRDFKSYIETLYENGTPVIVYTQRISTNLPDEEITDTTLISQLEKISNAKLTKDNTVISSDNERCIIDLTYYKDIETLIN